MISSTPHIIFCVGAPRSGTTLMNGLLSEGAEVYPMLPECTFVTQLINHYHDILNYSDKPRFDAFAKSKDNLKSIFSPSVQGFVEAAITHFQRDPKRFLALKDPILTLYLDLIGDFFTNFKTVCVVRDPRHVIASFARVEEKKGHSPVIKDLSSMVFNYLWRASESELAKRGEVCFFRYEDILARKETEFARLETYLGTKVGRTGFTKTAFGFDRTDPTFSALYGSPISTQTMSEPRLNAHDIKTIEQMFAGYNARFKWW